MSFSSQPKELYEFLVEAELDQYYTQMTTSLKVNTVAQIKYIEDDDLVDIGMTKPEMRRLKRFFKKESEPSALARLKKVYTSQSLFQKVWVLYNLVIK